MPESNVQFSNHLNSLTVSFEKIVSDFRSLVKNNEKLQTEEISVYGLMFTTYAQIYFKNNDIRDAKNALKAGDLQRFLEIFDSIKTLNDAEAKSTLNHSNPRFLAEIKKEVDEQHQKIADMFTEIGKIKMLSGEINEQLKYNLLAQLSYHFRFELKYMEFLKYPKMTEHHNDHIRYLREAKNKSLSDLVNEFLNHAHTFDRDIDV